MSLTPDDITLVNIHEKKVLAFSTLASLGVSCQLSGSHDGVKPCCGCAFKWTAEMPYNMILALIPQPPHNHNHPITTITPQPQTNLLGMKDKSWDLTQNQTMSFLFPEVWVFPEEVRPMGFLDQTIVYVCKSYILKRISYIKQWTVKK